MTPPATPTRTVHHVTVNYYYANGDVRKTSTANVVVLPGDTLIETCKSIFGQHTEIASSTLIP